MEKRALYFLILGFFALVSSGCSLQAEITKQLASLKSAPTIGGPLPSSSALQMDMPNETASPPLSFSGSHASPTVRISGVNPNNRVSIYLAEIGVVSGAPAITCTTLMGSAVASGSSQDVILTPGFSTYGMLYLAAIVDDGQGNSTGCPTYNDVITAFGAGTPVPFAIYTYQAPPSPPTAPTSLTLSNPTTSPGDLAKPTISVGGIDTSANSLVKLFTNSSCSAGSLVGSASSGYSSSVNITTTNDLPLGTYTFYANQTANSMESSCSTASVTYSYDPMSQLSVGPLAATGKVNDSATKNFTFTLSSAKPYGTTVYFSLTRSTATQGVSHNLSTRSVVIPANQTSVNVPFNILGSAEAGKEIQLNIVGTNSPAIQSTGSDAAVFHLKDTTTLDDKAVMVDGGTAGPHCVLKSDGSIVCVDFNSVTGAVTNVPVNSSEIFVSTSASTTTRGGCAITNMGSLRCWGPNTNGGVGDGTTTARPDPVVVDGGTTYSAVNLNCGLTTAGALKCWGNKTLPNNTPSSLVPVEVASGITFLKLGIYNAEADPGANFRGCAIDSTQHLQCWGYDQADPLSLLPYDSTRTYKDVIAGQGICGVTTEGTIRCSNSSNVQDSTNPFVNHDDPGIIYDKVAMSEATYTVCGITNLGFLRCVGEYYYSKYYSQLTPVGSGLLVKQVSVGMNGFYCLITNSDSRLCNYNAFDTAEDLTSVVPFDKERTYKKVAVASTANGPISCAISSLDKLYCWGRGDEFGDIGDGSINIYRSVPVMVDSSTSYKYITGDYRMFCGLTTDGTVKCWGKNEYEPFGMGSGPARYSPKIVDSGVKYNQISTNSVTTCGITQQNKLKCWGQYPDTYSGNNTPTEVDSGNQYSYVASTGYLKIIALSMTGELYAFSTGAANFGTPSLQDAGTSYKAIYGNCGLTTNNKLRCWNPNDFQGASDIDAGNDYVSINGGCGLTSGNSWKCWEWDSMSSSVVNIRTINPGTSYLYVTGGCGVTSTGELKCVGQPVKRYNPANPWSYQY